LNNTNDLGKEDINNNNSKNDHQYNKSPKYSNQIESQRINKKNKSANSNGYEIGTEIQGNMYIYINFQYMSVPL
jgi:hypothetical protein